MGIAGRRSAARHRRAVARTRGLGGHGGCRTRHPGRPGATTARPGAPARHQLDGGGCVSAQLSETLGTLATLPGVRAAVAATRSDGMAAATVAVADVDADALAAFATALFDRTRLANEAAGYGETRHLALD